MARIDRNQTAKPGKVGKIHQSDAVGKLMFLKDWLEHRFNVCAATLGAPLIEYL
jgi:hypothetical protein